MATRLSSNLKLRIDDTRLTPDSIFNLERLDTIGRSFTVTSTSNTNFKSAAAISLLPNSPDVGGSGTGGVINLGSASQPAASLNINANSVSFSTQLSGSQIDPNFEAQNICTSGEFRWKDALKDNYVGFKAPTILSSDQIWTLPSSDGSVNQVLATNGAGELSFITVSGAGGSSTYAQVFNDTTDWTLNGSEYEINITAITHGIGTDVQIQLFMLSGSDYELVEICDVILNTSGDVTLRVPATPDTRFSGKVILK